MNVKNLQHVVKGPNGWHDQTHVVESFIKDPTDPIGRWGPKEGGTGLAQGLGTFANSSRTPNCKLLLSTSGIWLVAIRPILKGEEITHKCSLSGAQTPKKVAQESATTLYPMQLQNSAYKAAEE